MYNGVVDRWAPLGESLRFGRVFNYYYFFGFCFCFFKLCWGEGGLLRVEFHIFFYVFVFGEEGIRMDFARNLRFAMQ